MTAGQYHHIAQQGLARLGCLMEAAQLGHWQGQQRQGYLMAASSRNQAAQQWQGRLRRGA